MDDSEVWDVVDERRQAVVDLLGELGPGDWDRPSLCDAWTVREVAAHLTLVALPRPRLISLFLRYPGSMNRTIRDASKAQARRMGNEEIRETIRSMIGLHRHFPGLTCREALVDVLGHTLDIAIPLHREVRLPTAALAEAADHVVSYGGTGNARVFRSLPILRSRLIATDHDWSTGAGPEITGTMTDLYLALIGRTVHLDRLGGEGAEALRDAVAQPA
ncbi:MAG: maleylpyruvate isomerase family mycothiol-dependent enzyme [Micrococcus sp.]|nr:maleylpyruvate isomerase family mycothiol-dependent enzyme [Micrococcus sp.]